MARAQQGDEEAYRALLLDVRPALLRTLRRHAEDAGDLEDLVQEVLLALHRARHSYDATRPFEPWLFAVARYEAWAHVKRRRKRRRCEVLEDEPAAYAAAEPASPAALERALARLKPAQRAAIRMLKVEGLSMQAAAARSGTTVGAMRVRAHRAYRALRALLRS